MARQDLTKLTRRTPAEQPEPAEQQEPDTTPTQEEPTPAPAPEIAIVADPAIEEPAKKPAPRKQATSRTATVPEDGGKETASMGVPVHLPGPLNDRLQAYMTRTRKSHQTVLLDAIEATYSRLPQLIREATAAGGEEEPQERVSLFSRPTLQAPQSTGETRIKHTVRVSPTNRQILDNLTAELEAPSRNFVIITAYEAFLPPINES